MCRGRGEVTKSLTEVEIQRMTCEIILSVIEGRLSKEFALQIVGEDFDAWDVWESHVRNTLSASV